MSNLNLDKLKEAQEELNKRSGSGRKNWLQVNKITEPLDGRILDPLPIMDGIYYQEIPIWWINGTKIISPKMFDQNLKKDIIDEIIEDAEKEAKKDKSLASLLKAKDDKSGMPRIQFNWEYWIPFLQFDWDYENDEIKDITNKDGTYNVDLISKYIVDNRVKILVSNITCLKAINILLTAPREGNMLDRVKGKNIQIQKTGERKNTKYYVIPTDKMPMPSEFYTPEKISDPYEVAQALAVNDNYMASVIEKYLYGDVEILDKDSNYRFPDIREKLKEKYKDDDDDEPQTKKPPKSGRRRTEYQGIVSNEPEESSSEQSPKEQPTRDSRAIRAAQAEQEKRDKAVDDLPFDKDKEKGKQEPETFGRKTPTRGGSSRRRSLTEDIVDTR